MAERMVALLRGINVGKAKRVGMADLRALVEGLGFRDVRTLLNSGNVVFTAPRPVAPDRTAERIEKALAERTGVSARVTVVTAAELDAAVAGNPLARVADEPARFLVAFLNKPVHRAKLEVLAKEDWAPEALGVGPRVAYLWCANGILDSRLWSAVGKALGEGVTSRNWATVLKLQALCLNTE